MNARTRAYRLGILRTLANDALLFSVLTGLAYYEQRGKRRYISIAAFRWLRDEQLVARVWRNPAPVDGDTRGVWRITPAGVAMAVAP